MIVAERSLSTPAMIAGQGQVAGTRLQLPRRSHVFDEWMPTYREDI